jgi:flavodoxin
MQKILMVYYSGGGNTKAMARAIKDGIAKNKNCLLYTSPSPRDRTRSRMPSSA